MEIVAGVHRVDGVRGSNVFLLLGDRLTLVDTGLSGNLPAIEAYLRQIGRDAVDLGVVVLTHFHPDHVGSLPQLYRRYGCRVAIHEAEVPYIEGRLSGKTLRSWGIAGRALSVAHRLWPVTPVPVSDPLHDGAVLPPLGGMQVIHTPGHTPGSICLYVPELRLLFTGDTVVHKQTGLSMPSLLFTADRRLAHRSLDRIAPLPVETFCFGHGRSLHDAPPGLLRAFADAQFHAQ